MGDILKNCIYELREVEKRKVEKMLSCMDPEKIGKNII
jgi:hypothetical protein